MSESGKGEQIRAACGIQLDEGGKKAICDTFLPCIPFACPLSPPRATPLIAIPILRLLSRSFVRHPAPRLPSRLSPQWARMRIGLNASFRISCRCRRIGLFFSYSVTELSISLFFWARIPRHPFLLSGQGHVFCHPRGDVDPAFFAFRALIYY